MISSFMICPSKRLPMKTAQRLPWLARLPASLREKRIAMLELQSFSETFGRLTSVEANRELMNFFACFECLVSNFNHI